MFFDFYRLKKSINCRNLQIVEILELNQLNSLHKTTTYKSYRSDLMVFFTIDMGQLI